MFHLLVAILSVLSVLSFAVRCCPLVPVCDLVPAPTPMAAPRSAGTVATESFSVYNVRGEALVWMISDCFKQSDALCQLSNDFGGTGACAANSHMPRAQGVPW